MSNVTLRLGKVDEGSMPLDKRKFLKLYHPYMSEWLKNKLKFRDEVDSVWRPFQEIGGRKIFAIQSFLKEAGFMPKANRDGIYGYGTMSAVRLFQEYVRTVIGDDSIGVPDGVAGKRTLAAIEIWKQERKNTNFVSEWGKAGAHPSEEYLQWLALLKKGKQYYLNNENEILKYTERYSGKTDTIKISNWDTSNNEIHLIGIRRNQEIADRNRKNDDLFVLLISGMVFYFWGSTDPNPSRASRGDIPFLTEGQHRYGFGWHNIGNSRKIYKALRPATNGVLVFRDRNLNSKLDKEDIQIGIDAAPNPTINIHWSGIGVQNFSAGCQVIAGASYINPSGEKIDCRSFTAKRSALLSSSKTRGAYNVLTDLILSYAPLGVNTLIYTLTRDDTAFLSKDVNLVNINEIMTELKSNEHL